MAGKNQGVWFTAILSLSYVLAAEAHSADVRTAGPPLPTPSVGPKGEPIPTPSVGSGEPQPTPSGCCSQITDIKTELDTARKILNSVSQELAIKNMAATALETKTGNLEKEIETLKSNDKKHLNDQAAQQTLIRDMITQQMLLQTQNNLLATQSRNQAAEVKDLKKQVASLLTNQIKVQQQLSSQDAVLKKHKNVLKSVTNKQVDIFQQVAEQTIVNQNQSREQNDFKITQAELRSRQNLLLKSLANHSFSVDAFNTKVDNYRADCENNIRNTTATLQNQINTFSRYQQRQDLQVKQQASLITKISEQRAVQNNKTSTRLKYLSVVYGQLDTELRNLEVTHNRLEQDFVNRTQQAKKTDDLLRSTLQSVQVQQTLLTTKLHDLESHLNLTYEILMEKTTGNKKGSKLDGLNCSDISGFKKGQVLSKRGSTQGTFGRDQLSKTGAFYSIEGWINVKMLNLYPSEADFIKNKNARSYGLPTECVGAQAQMIGGKLFCPQRNPATILVYDLANLNKPYKIINITLPGSATVRNVCQYSWGGLSYVDIEVDETGIYILWANNRQSCNFVLSRLDPITLNSDKHWQIPITKTGKGNAFMVCGKLYVTNSHDNKTSFISHVFDTHNNSIVTNPGIRYSNEYGYGAHAHYDLRDNVLYVWDRGHQLKVGIVWNQANN